MDAGQRMKFQLFALSFITVAAITVSAAEAQNYPWCARVDLVMKS
jgi:hypothetical protein